MEKSDILICHMATILLTCLLAGIDWGRYTLPGEVGTCLANLTGVLVGIWLIAVRGLRKYQNKICLGWLIGGMLVLTCLSLYVWGHPGWLYGKAALCTVAGVWTMGFSYCNLKKSRLPLVFWPMLGMLAWIFLSRNEDLWPLYYALIFFPVYWLEWKDEKQKEAIMLGVTEGLILMFFVLQGAAFVFRPFDQGNARYSGLYANENLNALFYCLVYLAFLLRSFYLKKAWLRIPFLAFAAAMWGFVLLTGCRTALFVLLGVSVLYVIFGRLLLRQDKALPLVGKIALFFLVMLLGFPVDYMAVRYLPPVFHHPVWFQEEYSEGKVHSWDPWDSEKYVSFERVLENFSGRIAYFLEHMGLSLRAQAADELEAGMSDMGLQEELEAGADGMELQEEPAGGMAMEERDISEDSIQIRIELWRYFLKNGNLFGHSNQEGRLIPGLEWRGYNWHAQNHFVQYWFYYGIPAAILFGIWILWNIVLSLASVIRGEETALPVLLFVAANLIFGLMEASWYPGQFVFFAIFFFPAFLSRGRKGNGGMTCRS